ncbi:MAG: trypsin-like peptidase domain-containing protein [Akkermansia sp.]|nr:trypsin-like peptidase domain-containing protein [Akkermansia sp.]
MIKRTATAALLATLPVLAEPEGAAVVSAAPEVQPEIIVPAEQPAPVAPVAEVAEQPAPVAPVAVPAEQPAPVAPVAEPAEQPAPVAPVAEQPAPVAPVVAPDVELAVQPEPAVIEEQPAAVPASKSAVDAYKGIVKIEVAIRQPDYATPWQSGRFGAGNGTGFMVAPGLFMTNAHVVANAERITVSPYGDARKYAARVKHVAHDADLALVEVTEAVESFKDVPCLQFSDTLPKLEDEVRAVGYPIGGSRLSVTRGIVSRIDTTLYSHSQSESHLTVQIDAAINPGNSGGPVLMGDKVVGVAFQGLLQANSTGYMIPMPVIKRFLKDVEDGHYDKYVDLAVSFFPLTNPTMRKQYGLAESSPGVLVGQVVKGGTCDGVLQPGDLLLAINDLPVDRSAMIELDGERVMLEELAERSFKDDKLRMRIQRDGVQHDVEVNLKPLTANEILAQEYDRMPRYVQFGGLVFQPLHRNVISAHQINLTTLNVDVEDYLKHGGSLEKQDLVLLTKVLKDEVNARCSTYGTRLVTKVNGVEVKGLEHLYNLLYPQDGSRADFTVIEFSDSPRPMVIDNAVIDAANARINARYGVPAAARLK